MFREQCLGLFPGHGPQIACHAQLFERVLGAREMQALQERRGEDYPGDDRHAG